MLFKSMSSLKAVLPILFMGWTSQLWADELAKSVNSQPWQAQGRELWNTSRGGFTDPSHHNRQRHQYLVRMIRTDFGMTPNHLEALRGVVEELNSGSDAYHAKTRVAPGTCRVVHASVVDQRSSRPFMNGVYGVIVGTDGSHVCATHPGDMEVWMNPQLNGKPPLEIAADLHRTFGIRTPEAILAETNTFSAADIRRGGGNNNVALLVPAKHDGKSLRALGIVGFSRPEWSTFDLYTPRDQEQFRKLAQDLHLPFVHLLQLTGAEDPGQVASLRWSTP